MREPVKFGDYYLFERVAVGGMAEVFKGVSYGVEGFERLFAVKRVLPNISEDQEFIEMFIDEAKIAVQLTHANIGQIFELGNAEDSYFIAMEFVQGKDLRAIFDRVRNLGGTLDIPMCCHIIKEVCEALEYAHSKRNERQESLNLVHRDVSPQNVIVSYDGEVKLIDFGIAKAAGKASKTQAGILKGKFGYMSPEQVRGKPIDRRSDLFSLAVVLYEVLTLERCFQGESDFSTLEKVRNVDIRRPTSINRNIPPELERIILKGLARNPNERYQSAAELQDALQKFLYQSGAFYSRKDLAAYMRKTFEKELSAETSRLSEFRDYARANIPEALRASASPEIQVEPPKLPATPASPKPSASPAAFKPDLPALSWEEDELETAVWDREEDDYPDLAQKPPAAASPQDAPTFKITPAVKAPGLPERRSPQPVIDNPQTPTPAFTHPVDFEPTAADVPVPPIGQQGGISTRVLALIVVALLAAVGTVLLVRAMDKKPEVARLTVKSQPSQVSVYVDGTLMHEGETPATLAELSVGEHEIKVTADDFQPLSQKLSFVSNEHKQLEVVLPSARAGASLEIETLPGGAQVFIDDKLVDETPVRVDNVAPGQRKLRIEKPGYQTWQGTVNAVDGKPLKVQPIELLPSRVTITFLPEPEEAKVTIIQPDGKRMVLGTGPQTYDGMDNRGNVRVILELAGHLTLEKRLPKFNRKTVTELLLLKPDPKAAGTDKVKRPTPPVRPRDKPRRPKKCVGEDCPKKTVRVTPPKQPDRPPKRPDPPVAKGSGYVKLMAKPPARAFINGREIGWTPILKHKLPAGGHQVTLIRDEEPKYRKKLSVVIKTDEVTFRRYIHK